MRTPVLRLLGCGLLGIAIGTVGTVMHRSTAPWGLVLALAVVLSGGVFARAWAGWGGFGAYALGWIGAVVVLWQRGPGGDLLVPDLGIWGNAWILGGLVALALPAIAPSSWFTDEAR